MLFTKGSNVGVGPITIAKGSAPSIVVTPAILDLESVGQLPNGMQMKQMDITYHNLDITGYADFTIQFYDADGEEQAQPTWITPNPVTVMGGDDVAYFMTFIIAANDGAARSAYFKVYALDADEDMVYSNLVTINQAAAPQQYTLTVDPFENLDLITFVNDEMVMEGDGEIQVNEGDQVMLSVVALEGYVMETLMVNGENHVNDIADDFTYSFEMPAEDVVISATAAAPTPGSWVLTDLADITEDDVFVIVGVYDEDLASFAMPNNGTQGAPPAVDVTIVGNTLSGEIAENIQWNLSIGEDGYTFYPNGETETWLYCNNSNNGIRVGDGDNNVFTMSDTGYLINIATSRYIGIFDRQDWRCYTSVNNNIKNQSFAFYKKIKDVEEPSIAITPDLIEVSAEEADGILTVTYNGIETDLGTEIFWYEADGTTTATYDWIVADFNADNIEYVIEANDGAARTAYMRVYGLDAELNDVYSNLVTISQAAPTPVTVTIIGHTSTLDYDGSEHSVSGYDVTAIEIDGVATDLYTEEDFTFSGLASAARTESGTTYMGLTNEQFTNTNANFIVTFNVTDGWLEIIPACEKLTLDENNRWFDDFEYEGTPTVNPTHVSPTCWTWTSLVEDMVAPDTMPQLHRYSSFANSGSYSLRFWHRGVYAMPELDESIESVNQLQMSFYVRQPYPYYTLQVGVMDDPTDPESFVPVAVANNGSSTGVEYFECNFANYEGTGRYIAFKNVPRRAWLPNAGM